MTTKKTQILSLTFSTLLLGICLNQSRGKAVKYLRDQIDQIPPYIQAILTL